LFQGPCDAASVIRAADGIAWMLKQVQHDGSRVRAGGLFAVPSLLSPVFLFFSS
jgi:hypothetical protein